MILDKAPRNQPWPLSLRGEMGAYSTGKGDADYRTIMRYGPQTSPNYSHNQGYLLANYLAGTNAAGQPVNWPVFPGIIDAGICRQIHAEAARQHRGPNSQHWFEGHFVRLSLHFRRGGGADWASLYGRALRVPGLAKPPMGDRRWTLHEGYPNVHGNRGVSFGGNLGPGKSFERYTPPEATFDIWLEWWLPAGYFGGTKVLPLENSRFVVGHRYSPGLNAIDFPRFLTEPSRPNPFAAPLPRDA